MNVRTFDPVMNRIEFMFRTSRGARIPTRRLQVRAAPDDRWRVHTVHLAEWSNRWTFDRRRGNGWKTKHHELVDISACQLGSRTWRTS